MLSLFLITSVFSSLNHYFLLNIFNLPKFCSHILSLLSFFFFLLCIQFLFLKYYFSSFGEQVKTHVFKLPYYIERYLLKIIYLYKLYNWSQSSTYVNVFFSLNKVLQWETIYSHFSSCTAVMLHKVDKNWICKYWIIAPG